jgi:hypothetical protein
MSVLTFLNPAYLGALGLAAIPIIIHLIRRRRIKVIPWAAWDFLVQSRRKNRRRLRIEQLLLLFLRILIVCLVVLAFCRPILRMIGLPLIAEDTRVHALIVVDNSFSMGYKASGISDFDRAKKIADDLMTKVLKQGDSVQLVLLSSHPSALIKEPTYSISKAREKLRTANLCDYAQNYTAGASLCTDMLKNVSTPVKEVYWITNNQKTGFSSAEGGGFRKAFQQLAAEGRITWIDAALGDRANLSVDSPLFSRELITPQAPVQIEATVHNYSSAAHNDLLVDLYVDGRAVGTTRVKAPAWGKTQASFLYLFDTPGAHTGYIRLASSDALERDNTVWFSAKVRDRLKVLIIDPHPSQDVSKDEAFYLTTALAPSGASTGGSTSIQPTVHMGSKIAGLNLRGYDAVVIAGMTDFSPQDRIALQDFTANGGGVLLFPGPYTDPSRINAEIGGNGSILPASLGSHQSFTDDNPLTLNAASINQSALNAFRNSQDIILSSANFHLVYNLTPRRDNLTKVACRFSNGQPALVEGKYGQGKVILASFPAGISGGTLPYKPAYLPIIQQLVAYLAAGPTSQRNLNIGSVLITRFPVEDANKPVRVTNPSGQVELINSALGADGAVAEYTHTSRAGIYQFGVAGNDKSDAFALNLPSSGSDLTVLDNSRIQSAMGAIPVQFANASQDILSVVRQSRRGTEMWRTLILAALSLLFLEGILAQRFGRR